MQKKGDGRSEQERPEHEPSEHHYGRGYASTPGPAFWRSYAIVRERGRNADHRDGAFAMRLCAAVRLRAVQSGDSERLRERS